MKELLFILTASTLFSFCMARCYKHNEPVSVQNHSNNALTNPIKNKMNITVGPHIFTATLTDNATVEAFKAMLPMTINMSELNANEKFFYLSSPLPISATPGSEIRAGDLMLYGNNCLVLFYENLQTSYSYTRIGKVDDISGLKAALGTSNVTVTLELQK